MAMQLDEQPVGPPDDADGWAAPETEPAQGGRMERRQLTILETGPAREIQPKRSLDNQWEGSWRLSASEIYAFAVRNRFMEWQCTLIQRVDFRDLRRIGC